MSEPSADPKMLQVIDALCTQLAGISQATGYYSDVVAAGIEPITFDNNDGFPQIVIEEDSNSISDSTASGFQESAVLRVAGFLRIKSTTTPIRTAHRLRTDITLALQRVTGAKLLDVDGAQLTTSYAVAGQRDINVSSLDPNFLEVAVRVAIDCRIFPAPALGA